MKTKIVYTDEPIGKYRVVKDFLPPPEKLVFKDDSIKVTMSLSKSTIQFFKQQAQKNHAPYQRMIRSLLDSYAVRYGSLK